MTKILLEVLITGLLLGGLYALISVGLSLQYGVARILNISHGEFIMLGAMTTWTLYTALHVNPLLSLIICGPLALALGYLIHRTLFKRLLASSASPAIFESNSMLAAFGLMFILQNIASIAWGARDPGILLSLHPGPLSGNIIWCEPFADFWDCHRHWSGLLPVSESHAHRQSHPGGGPRPGHGGADGCQY
jgi:branched-chain amino acid transport system permease protein